MYLEIGLVILVIILIILLIFCIPILLQIWRILKDVRVTLETLNQEFADDIEKYGRNYHKILIILLPLVNRKIQNISNTVDRSQLIISDIIDNIQCIAPIVHEIADFSEQLEMLLRL
ncbi:MAG: hypothetical protein MZV70_48300 [Desulfobacterales bacterium]|nr:hypothetical protein [Desulfobacterales bacterium]